MAVQSSSTTESTPPSKPVDQTVPARERALKQWRGDAVKELRREADREAPQPDQPATAPEGQSEQGDKPRRGLLRRHPIGAAVGLVLLLAAATGGYVYFDAASHDETTDDAFIAARQFSIAPKISGYITSVPVTDNQRVKAGDVIARIDDRDYRTALAQAAAQVRSAEAAIHNIDAQIDVQQAQITAGQAQVEQAQASLTFAEQQAQRYQDLARTGSGTVQNEQQYNSQLRQQKAALSSAQANLQVAQRQLESLKAQRESAQANLAQAEAQRDQAQLNLSYTTVTAAQPGRIVNLSAADGQFAAQGTALTMFVPDDVWVTANFKETQLDHMRPGQPVTLQIDAYPEREIRGHVASVQSGSGPAFSLLPPQNATGNYVKIVQRVPVKIEMDDPPADVALGPGMSVVPTVRVDPTPTLYERLKARL
ncbi:hemolysin secretion protein D [Bradyrhizobium sp. SSBR45G]|uniref:HlyD family secretion protein n=1 Tax=unclassified Bradyrhizobium TaxID=2631580 RepID=UPI0023429D7A|nr:MULTISPECIES: HlyD family secretion protein [unclassified Bradyrhizobium]GLH79572.1 hemolysin secretion protein D [Bradyrhizobium sp. SSBR45G]GLH87033.1 hemolysin secretion protein D [Bradyrhizobium sp. SSBR45R]